MPKYELDPEDPNELVGIPLPGNSADEEYMAVCLIDEYVRMGYGREQLMKLFRDPFFRLPHGVYLRNGEEYVVRLVESVLARWGGRPCPT